MAKATHSQEILTGTSDSYTEHELSDPNPPVVVTRAVLGGELLSVGNNSETSSTKQKKTNDGENQSPQALAQTTENPSLPQEKETDSNVTLTGGSGQSRTAKQSASPAKKAAKKASPRQARVRSTDDDDFEEFE